MLVPPQSLQTLLWRLCWQMPAPPQCLHALLRRLCSQMLTPPQSLQALLRQAVTPGETLGTLYNIHVGSNKTKQHELMSIMPDILAWTCSSTLVIALALWKALKR